MRFADILKASPRDMPRPVREAIARATAEWRQAVEQINGRDLPGYAKAYVKAIGDPRAEFAVALQIPGDRGLSRELEADEIPTTVQQAINRRLRTAQARVDQLNGAATFQTKQAFARMKDRLFKKARELARAGNTDITPIMRAETQALIDRELRSFQSRIVDRYGGLLKRGKNAGDVVADVPFRVAGLTVPPKPPDVDEDASILFANLTAPRRKTDGSMRTFSDEQTEKIADVVNRVRRGTIGQQRGDQLLQQIIDEPLHHAERIMRTEIGKATKAEANRRLQDHGRKVTGLKKEWVSALLATTRPAHSAAHRQVVGVDELFEVGGERTPYPMGPGLSAWNSINCVPGDTLVAGRFIGATESLYDGDLFEIRTARGARLSVTPNHPIPTNQGWRKVHELREGDYVLSRAGDVDRDVVGAVDEEDRPARIDDIARTLALSLPGRLRPARVDDFDGDGAKMAGDVHVIGPDRELWNGAQGERQSGNQLTFMMVAVGYALASRLGPGDPRRRLLLAAAHSSPGIRERALDQIVALAWREMPPLFELRRAIPAQLDACLSKLSGKAHASDPGFFVEAEHGAAGLIARDQIVEIKRRAFHGSVFDLQSPHGVILANGIALHNCLCVSSPIVDDVEIPDA